MKILTSNERCNQNIKNMTSIQKNITKVIKYENCNYSVMNVIHKNMAKI